MQQTQANHQTDLPLKACARRGEGICLVALAKDYYQAADAYMREFHRIVCKHEQGTVAYEYAKMLKVLAFDIHDKALAVEKLLGLHGDGEED